MDEAVVWGTKTQGGRPVHRVRVWHMPTWHCCVTTTVCVMVRMVGASKGPWPTLRGAPILPMLVNYLALVPNTESMH